jgi:hypothetical protein
MAIQTNDLVKTQDVVDRINTRLRDLVTASTAWVAGTDVWNTNVGTVTASSTSYGGGYNRTASATATADSATTSNFAPVIGGSNGTAGHVVKVLKDLMALYAQTHKVTLNNTGNLAPANYTGIVKLNGVDATAAANVQSDVNTAATARAVVGGSLVTATNLNNLIEDCRTIWTNRAFTPVVENYYYSYCHSSCHSNCHTSHGSRGRR